MSKASQVYNFIKEVEQLTYIDHENFVKFIGVTIEPKLTLLTEYIEGDTLENYIQK